MTPPARSFSTMLRIWPASAIARFVTGMKCVISRTFVVFVAKVIADSVAATSSAVSAAPVLAAVCVTYSTTSLSVSALPTSDASVGSCGHTARIPAAGRSR